VKPQREQVTKFLAVGRARIHLDQFRIQLAILTLGNSCKVNWVVENC
jgi:hypothetical protein